ncbi:MULTISPECIES: GreA/GreB family elongation factor [unclassified Sphingomonas]|uniref:GreA/GreB family elongation factor n=1 Tax=unclassified Sphingomonas TaxID=196159 RepID=UPI002150C501|nr:MULTISPECIES: GreA/GreB family elongation factor [unclassified Sphingomonas]MCR5870884.1 GreA/GreB family elongation factor [Sphingomonas sp. J344]UUY00796.1 GreA/GreB family elongation factor [Sphingomonas sp. J315]
MSVAFRRESDEDHKEPRFELPIPVGPNPVTERGRALIDQRVRDIEAQLDGLEGEEARAPLLRDLRYWHTRQTTAEVAPVPEPGVVAIGSRVRFRIDGRERTIDIVGHDEADPAAGRVAFQAPLAAAMIGAEDGEAVDFNGRSEAIEIVSAEPIPA